MIQVSYRRCFYENCVFINCHKQLYVTQVLLETLNSRSLFRLVCPHSDDNIVTNTTAENNDDDSNKSNADDDNNLNDDDNDNDDDDDNDYNNNSWRSNDSYDNDHQS